MESLQLSQIIIYPIKGCAGISLQSSKVCNRGLLHDRRLMLVDEEGKFVSQRTTTLMALIKTELDNEQLIVTYRGDAISIPLQYSVCNQIQVAVWDDQFNAYLMNDRYHHWFSNKLGVNVRLVVMEGKSRRAVDPRYANSDKDEVSFADAFPYLIIGQASLDYLNQKITSEEMIEMDRFRPSLIFTGGSAHEEDTWREFSIGNVHLSGKKPCARCQVPTYNQHTGAIEKEPIKTLSSYRRKGNKILFGQYCLLKQGDTIKVGDAIDIFETGEDLF